MKTKLEEILDMMNFSNLNWEETEEGGVKGFTWTIEEHCYTAWIIEDKWKVFDSEGDLPKELRCNLQALKYYFKLEMLKVTIGDLLYE